MSKKSRARRKKPGQTGARAGEQTAVTTPAEAPSLHEAAQAAQSAIGARKGGRDRKGVAQTGRKPTGFFAPVVIYYKETREELKKVTWPSREESLRLTGVVLAVTVAFSLFLGGLDFVFLELFKWGLSLF